MSWILATLLFLAAIALLSRLGRRILEHTRLTHEQPDDVQGVTGLDAVEATGDTLDLHGAPPAEITALVDAFIESSRQRGHRWVRIVHGKGTGTQRRMVRARLAQRADVIGFRDAPPPSGWGATVVEIDTRNQGTP